MTRLTEAFSNLFDWISLYSEKVYVFCNLISERVLSIYSPSVTPHLAAWLLIPAAAAVQACNLTRIYQRHSRPLKWVAGGQQWQQQQQRLYAMAATATDSVSNVDWFCFILLRLLLLLLLFPWRPVRWLQSALPHHLHQQQQHHQKHGKHNVPHRKVEAEMCRIILLLLLLLPIQRQFFKLCPQW